MGEIRRFVAAFALAGSIFGPATAGAQGVLTNGANHEGLIAPAMDEDRWTFTAAAGERIVLRTARFNTTNSFTPRTRLLGPDGALLDQSSAQGEVITEMALTIAVAGTHTVVVSDGTSGGTDGTGRYRLQLVQLPGTIAVADDGGALTNGINHAGLIHLGDMDAWSFAATAGQRVVLRTTAFAATNNLGPWVRIYGPEGVLLEQSPSQGVAVGELAFTVVATGTHTVLVADGLFGGLDGTGRYRLQLIQAPGVVAVDDEGGPLTSGFNHQGFIPLGDMDPWSFTASPGQRVVLRTAALAATNSFGLWVRIFSPDGALLDQSSTQGVPISDIVATITQAGTHTVLVADGTFGGLDGTGRYGLQFVQLPAPFVVADDGGTLTNGADHEGLIHLGDLDVWTFLGCRGERVTLRVAQLTSTNNFSLWTRLYGPDGVLAAQTFAGSGGTNDLTAHLPYSGLYTVVVGDGTFGRLDGTGRYRLNAIGIASGLTFCKPWRVGSDVNLGAVGGVAGGGFVLLTSPNVARPLTQWQPILTNRFDASGLFEVTRPFDRSEPQRFFVIEPR